MSILEISNLNCYLSCYRGFLVISHKGDEIKRIPFDHISSIITKAHGISYSHNLLVRLSELNIPLVLTDQAFKPCSILTPCSANYINSKYLNAQINTATTLQNLLWQLLVKSKVRNQIAVLNLFKIPHDIDNLLDKITSGDKYNIEAQAAKKYWKLLLGQDFIRHRFGDGPNSLLNYGYTILRSSISRYICASGLNPSIGIFHCNSFNTFRLSDDLIEPFRPVIDIYVYKLYQKGKFELDSEVKNILVSSLETPLRVGTQWFGLNDCIRLLCQSLAQAYLKQKPKLKLFKSNFSKVNLNDYE